MDLAIQPSIAQARKHLGIPRASCQSAGAQQLPGHQRFDVAQIGPVALNVSAHLLILVFLFVINLMTSPGEWWVQWAALGIGIAWVINLFKVLRALLVVGGLAGLAALINRR